MMRATLARAIHNTAAPVMLVCALLLGGASSAGAVANALLQLIAIGTILMILASGALGPPLAAPAKALLWLFGLMAAIMAMQLLPLPSAVWTALPERETIVAVFRLADANVGWQPISLAPEATIGSLLSLLPPVAMILAIFASDARGRSRAIITLIAAALLSLALGIAQLLGGPHNLLYLYAITNRGSAVGLFANRNHLATLLLCALPFLTIAFTHRHGEAGRGLPLRIVGVGTAMLLLSGGILLIGSRAGFALLLPTLVAGALLTMRASNARAWMRGFALVAAPPCLAALIFGASLSDGAPGAAAQVAAQHRSMIIPTTLRAAVDYLPLGSGGGSFQTVYPAYEDPSMASPEYVNHAHSDLAEIMLEYGIPGLVILGLALIFWTSRVIPAWRLEGQAGIQARAALAALAIIFLSSTVDYPVRTAAIAVMGAMAAALAAMPRPPFETPPSARQRRRRSQQRLSISIDEM